MVIKLKCPSCEAHLRLNEAPADRKVCCPQCRHVFVAPSGEADPALAGASPSEAKQLSAKSRAARSATSVAKPKRSKPGWRLQVNRIGWTVAGLVVLSWVAGGVQYALRSRGSK